MEKTFSELGVDKQFIKGLNELGIKHPTDIQEQAIPFLLEEGTDFIGQAQTGTGKTVAFGLPVLHKIDPDSPKVQALILCPTRELGKQIAKQLFRFTKYSEKIFTEAVYGGEKIELQIARLSRPTHIVVATPGRLVDLIRRKKVDVRQVKHVILDEADEMLKMGFKEDLNIILDVIKTQSSKWLFSATLSEDVNTIIDNYLSKEAKRITIDMGNVVNKSIVHEYIVCEQKQKFTVLLDFLKNREKERGVVFCKTKASARQLTRQLRSQNCFVDVIHGDLLQKERDKVMRAFKNKKIQTLIATDVSARGIDIENLAYVAHYELPDNIDYYTHRSGRTARAGRKGVSLSFVTSDELKHLKYIERQLNIVVNEIS